VGPKFLEDATLQKGIGLELIRRGEDWQHAFISKIGSTPKTVQISWPMGSSVPKTRRVITQKIRS
jgi:hypothetical protein